MAVWEGDSPGSERPAGISMTILSRGGRYCFWRIIEGSFVEEEFSRMATIPTPSMSEPEWRVVRSADSQVRIVPWGSLYIFLEGRRVSMYRGLRG